jgi:hypothetical protein
MLALPMETARAHGMNISEGAHEDRETIDACPEVTIPDQSWILDTRQTSCQIPEEKRSCQSAVRLIDMDSIQYAFMHKHKRSAHKYVAITVLMNEISSHLPKAFPIGRCFELIAAKLLIRMFEISARNEHVSGHLASE